MRSPGCNIACMIRMLAAADTSAIVAAIVLEMVASGSTSVTGGLTTGGGGGNGVLEIVSPGFATRSGEGTGAGSSLLVELSPLAATPAPCELPFFDLGSSIRPHVPRVLMRRR